MIGRTLENPNPTGNEMWLGQQLAQTYAEIAKRELVRQATMDKPGTWRALTRVHRGAGAQYPIARDQSR